MDEDPIRYALLRDGRSWEAELGGLELRADGSLELARVPGPADGRPVDLPVSGDVRLAGLAVRGEDEVLAGDGDRLVVLDGLCAAQREMRLRSGPAERLGRPRAREARALLVTSGHILVADPGAGAVLRLLRPGLQLAEVVRPAGAPEPIGLAIGAAGLYVLDDASRCVLRLQGGTLDEDFRRAQEAAGPPPGDPRSLTVGRGHGDPGPDGRRTNVVYVADGETAAVLRLDAGGAPLAPLPGGGPRRPGATAAAGARLYVADDATGRIWVFDAAAGGWLGPLPRWRGPAAGLAVTAAGDLLVHAGPGPRIVRLAVGVGRVERGHLLAGPLDAGDGAGWGRVRLLTAGPTPGGAVELRVFTADDPAQGPGAGWEPAVGTDLLAPRAAPEVDPAAPGGPASVRRGNRLPRPRRYLWVRANLVAGAGTAPVLEQVRAESAGTGWLAGLPALYREADESGEQAGFLHDFLELLRSVLGEVDERLDELPRTFDPAVAPEALLPWLASWVALDPPPRIPAAQLRDLILRAVALHGRRGTVSGLREQVELVTGLRVRIEEDFRQRRIWRLGSARLGTGTALASLDPGGMVVPDEDASPPVGGFTVGGAGPLAAGAAGDAIFGPAAHRFRVVVPPGQRVCDADRADVERVVDRERPAHTAYHVCVVEPRLRVGVQARVGLDAVVAGRPAPGRLDGTRLGTTAVLGTADEAADRIGRAGVARAARPGAHTGRAGAGIGEGATG